MLVGKKIGECYMHETKKWVSFYADYFGVTKQGFTGGTCYTYPNKTTAAGSVRSISKAHTRADRLTAPDCQNAIRDHQQSRTWCWARIAGQDNRRDRSWSVIGQPETIVP